MITICTNLALHSMVDNFVQSTEQLKVSHFMVIVISVYR